MYRSSEQNHPKGKKKQEGKWLSEDSLQIVEERSEKQGKKGKLHPTKCRVPKNNKENKKDFFKEKCLKIEENNRRGKARDLFRRI